MFGGVGNEESNDWLYLVREGVFVASFIVVKLVGGNSDVYTGSSDRNVESEEEEGDDEEEDEDEARRFFCVSTDSKALSFTTFLSDFSMFAFINELLFASEIGGVLRLPSKDAALPIVIKLGRIVPFIVSSE